MHIGLIVKVSKLCNLRCTYCCEGAELADRRRMSVSDIERMYEAISDSLTAVDSTGGHRVTFYWHGGEPFAQPIAYWEAVLDAQQRAFARHGRRVRILNAIQSNLTLITAAHLPLLRRFRLGFSFDVLNSLRVFANGRDSTARVISRIEWLMAQRVPLAGIVVVSRVTADHPGEVAAFYVDRNLPFRFIHLDEGLEHLPGIYADRVEFGRYLAFARALFSSVPVRRAMARGLRIDPLTLAAKTVRAARRSRRANLTLEDCAEQEHLLEVNTDGQVYSTSDYPYRQSYGNIFREPLHDLLASPGRRARIARAEERLREVCDHCELFRHGCAGTWVAHATEPQYQEFREHRGCELRAIAGWMTDH